MTSVDSWPAQGRAPRFRFAAGAWNILSKKINEMQEEVARGDKPGVIPASLRRLENERNHRRALPISAPTSVDQAIAMLEEAWSLTEMEQPPDLRRAAYLVHVVNNWLQDAAAAPKYDKYFSGMAKTTAMMSVGMAKGNVNDLEHKFRFGATIGGWWPATIDSLKASRELVQIMSGEKRMEETKFDAIGKTINTASWATPAIGAAVLAAPAVIAAGAELIPAGLEAGGWMAARAAPRAALWIGSHPVLAAEIGGSALALGEKISEGDLTPEDVLWTLLTLGHANMQDKSMFRPSTPGPNDFTPKRAPNQVLAAFIRGLNDAEVLPEFSPGTGGGAPNRPIPAIVASAPPAADAPENMPTPFRKPQWRAVNILIVKLSSLGDVVHAMPAVQDMRAAYPQARIDWVVDTAFAPLVHRCEGVDTVISCGLRRWRQSPLGAQTGLEWRAFRDALRHSSYDAVIDLQGLTKSALVSRAAWLTVGGKRYAMANQTDGSSYEAPTRWLADVAIPIEPHVHAVARSRELCARALGYEVPAALRFGLSALAAASRRPKTTRRPASSWSTALRAPTSAGPSRTGSNSDAP